MMSGNISNLCFFSQTHLIIHILGRPPFSTILEYRGKSFSVGGDPGEYTLPNFLSVYADEVKGSPEGITLPLSRGKELNNAVRETIKSIYIYGLLM